MSIEGLLAAGLIFIGVALWIVSPLLQRGQRVEALLADEVALQRQRERLQVYYERALRNLHDLDEDHATGKLSEAEYRADRERWVQRGILALKALDQLALLDLAVDADEASIDAAISEQIEAAMEQQGVA